MNAEPAVVLTLTKTARAVNFAGDRDAWRPVDQFIEWPDLQSRRFSVC